MRTDGTFRAERTRLLFLKSPAHSRFKSQNHRKCTDSRRVRGIVPGLKLEIFTLCESAADYGGKLCILGGFDRIHSQEVPLVLPRCSVVARLRVHRIEEGDHKLRMTIADEDGKSIVPGVEAQVSVRFLQELNSATVNLILQVNGLKLERHGEYTIDLAVDGIHQGSLPLYFSPPPQAQPGPGHASS